MEETKGHCEHGEFDLVRGCPLCIADREGREGNTEASIAEAIEAVEETERGLTTEEETDLRVNTEEAGMELVSETAVVKIAPSKDEAVIALHEQSLKLEQYAVALVITSDDDVKGATNDLSIISGLKKAIEEKRKEYTQPINEHLKAVNEAFKAFVEPLLAADKITKTKVLDYRAEQKRIRVEQEEINRLRLEAAQKEMELKGELTESVDLVEVAPEAPTTIRTDMGNLGAATIWKWEVVDFSLVPDRFKMENATLIGKVVRAGEREIPGIMIWSEETLRVTTKKEG